MTKTKRRNDKDEMTKPKRDEIFQTTHQNDKMTK